MWLDDIFSRLNFLVLFKNSILPVFIPTACVGLFAMAVVFTTKLADRYVGGAPDPAKPPRYHLVGGSDFAMFAISLCVIKTFEILFFHQSVPYIWFFVAVSLFSAIVFILMISLRSTAVLRHELHMLKSRYGRKLGWNTILWSNITGMIVVLACGAALFRPVTLVSEVDSFHRPVEQNRPCGTSAGSRMPQIMVKTHHELGIKK